MSLYLAEAENIYFEKTKRYFNEVITSYSIGNYRSAVVMLYSVAICDILFKLQELKDMFNDTKADEILKDIEKSRNSSEKSKWEKLLVDRVYKETELLDFTAYTNLNHLYDYRNFSAHPAMNDEYELIEPSKEVTIACIKNTLGDVLVKPPIFIKNVVGMLVEDLKGKTDIYIDNYNSLKTYLYNKYYSKMSETMKKATMKALWKFCFRLPDNEECMNNIIINRKALEILISTFPEVAKDYIKNNKDAFSISNKDIIKLHLTVLLSRCEYLYDSLNEDTKLQIEDIIEKKSDSKTISWFKFKRAKDHLDYLKSIKYIDIKDEAIEYLVAHYFDIGETRAIIDFLIWYYGESWSFDIADQRFALVIEPYLDKMSERQFEKLIEISNKNSQIYNRGLAKHSNTNIVIAAKKVLPEEFDYSCFKNFEYRDEVQEDKESESISDLPF